MTRDVLEHFDEPHDGESLRVLDELHARRTHLVAADRRSGARSGRRASSAARDAGRVQVAGSFAGDEQDLTHGRAATTSARRATGSDALDVRHDAQRDRQRLATRPRP